MRPNILPLFLISAGLLSMTGCSFSSSTGFSQVQTSSTAPHGSVHGGQQPVAGATIQLYSVGTSMDGSASAPLLTKSVTTDANGDFTITGSYSCTNATQVYVLASGGNPGQASVNPNIQLMAALGACTSLNASTFININELTTVAAAYALAPYITSATAIGSGSSDIAGLDAAFALASELVSVTAGAAPGIVPGGDSAPTATINHLGNAVAQCVNSTGGTAGDGTQCGNFFQDTTVTGSVPTDPIVALRNLALNPMQSVSLIYGIASASGPFQPQLSAVPPDWRIRLLSSTPTISLSNSSLSYASLAVGYPSATQTLTLTNTSSSSVTLNSIGVTGVNAADFSDASACSTTLQALASCTVQIAITPSATGARSAYLGISSSTGDSPQYVTLAGVGVSSGGGPLLGLSTSSLSFTQSAETTSGAQTITVTNTGTASLAVSGVNLSGSSASNFVATNGCLSPLSPAATCTIQVTFTPFLAAAHSATLSVASNAGLPQNVSLSGTGTGSVTLNTSNSTNWVISTGTTQYLWDPATCHITGVYFANSSGNNLVDTTNTSNGYPNGLYMDNTGVGTGTNTYGYSFGPNNDYLDWWCQTASNASNAFTTTQHFVTTANDTGFHVYSTVAHSPTDVAGSIGQWQYVFRIDLNKFVTTYSNNSGLNNLGVTEVPQPSVTDTSSADPGRAVQNAAEDLHGFTDLPSGFLRSFYTKYDYASYEYLHQEHGVYGTQYGAWTVVPSTESMSGGPTKQDLIFTNNILMMEVQSGHDNSNLAYTPPQGVQTTRLFGPFYFHFNQFTATNTTPASLYAEAQAFLPSFHALYDSDSTLSTYGYVPSTARGSVVATISGMTTAAANTAWYVLSDNATNHQYTSTGRQYWLTSTTGSVQFSGVVPGTYRLSAYVLGEYGELRYDNIVVAANQTTVVTGTFTPENFGISTPIWTIGTPDRSGHEFLHGEDANGNDFRNYWGAYNYWADFASTNGQQIYYATAVGSTPATNNLQKMNYVQWQQFNPGLFAGVYNASDDTTDGYKYVAPSYVTSLTQDIPNSTIYFTATSSQLAQGSYAVLSIPIPCTEASVTATLNGHALVWHYINAGDCMIRSGLSGYYQWVVFEWPTSDLSAAGAQNVLTLGPSQPSGFMLDAMRFEITNKSSNPGTTGWHDYEWVNSSTYTAANDVIPNN